MALATARFLQKVERGELHHDGKPLLAMGVANAVPRLDSAGNITLEKRSARGRIDPLVAAIMALQVAEDDGSAVSSYLNDGGPMMFVW